MFGISGLRCRTVGVEDSKLLLAVNGSKTAPIARLAEVVAGPHRLRCV